MAKRKKKIKIIKKRKYIKDKAIINFILQHSKQELIDFSKLKIPLFLESLKHEEEDLKYFKENFLNKRDELNNSYTNQKLPKFGLSLLDELNSEVDSPSIFQFSSSLFQ